LPISPHTWAEINDDPENYSGALALEMDEPLYNAIYDTYATTENPKLDNPSDTASSGRITTAEAGAWGGKTISLNNK
jgi:hypothetical protein